MMTMMRNAFIQFRQPAVCYCSVIALPLHHMDMLGSINGVVCCGNAGVVC